MRWADSTGTLIDGAFGVPMKYVDAEGAMWDVEPFSGAISAPRTDLSSDFTLSNCTGVRLMRVGNMSAGRPIWQTPRVPFFDALQNVHRVLEDDAALTTVANACSSNSSNSPAGCSQINPCFSATGIPETDTRVVPLPAVPGTTPYHPVVPE